MVAPDKDFMLIVVQGKNDKKEDNEWLIYIYISKMLNFKIIFKFNQNLSKYS